MTEYLDKNEKIYKHLKLRKPSHGEIYLDSIISSSSTPIDDQKLNELGSSIVEFQGNIPPLVVRQVNQDDDEFYEVIYGAEVYDAAKLIKAEKLWAWVLEIEESQVSEISEKISRLLANFDFELKVTVAQHLYSIQKLDQKLLKLQQQKLDAVNQLLEIVEGVRPKILKINHVTFNDLTLVPGIATVSANKIIQNQQFTDLDDLKNKVGKRIKETLLKHFTQIVFD